MKTIKDLVFDGSRAVLLRYPDGEAALWIRDEFLAERSDTPGSYTINDINQGEPIDAGEDLEEAVLAWKESVDWASGVLS